MVKSASFRNILSLAVSRSWLIHQLDVTNDLLRGTLSEPFLWTTIQIYRPSFSQSCVPSPQGIVRSPPGIARLVQAHCWSLDGPQIFGTQVRYFSICLCLWFLDIAYLILYVDDIILTTSTSVVIRSIIGELSHEFDIKDLRPLHHFLGITVTCCKDGLFLSQYGYAIDIHRCANISSCNPCRTATDSKGKLSAASGPLISYPTLNRSLVSDLQYLTFNRWIFHMQFSRLVSFMIPVPHMWPPLNAFCVTLMALLVMVFTFRHPSPLLSRPTLMPIGSVAWIPVVPLMGYACF